MELHETSKPPTRHPKFAGEPCPTHGIIVHRSKTYTYTDYRRNLAVDADYFHRHIRWHPFKLEAMRFGSERSEDCVTWVVFRSLQNAGLLGRVAELCTGVRIAREPRLFLWGLELRPAGVEPSDLLIKARERFESDLPVDRPKTEPDIILYQPGAYVLLVEAKLCSPNGTYKRDKETKLLDLTLHQLINIYQDPGLVFLDYDQAQRRDRIYYQLWRNLIFAEHMAQIDGHRTEAYHANLVRMCHDDDSCEQMLTLLRPEYRDRFNRITWEDIYAVAHQHRPETERLCRYLENKTAGLRPAFDLPKQQQTEGV